LLVGNHPTIENDYFKNDLGKVRKWRQNKLGFRFLAVLCPWEMFRSRPFTIRVSTAIAEIDARITIPYIVRI
jgi:hypothetical protein